MKAMVYDRYGMTDVILDVVENRSIFDYKRLLKPEGTYVMVGGPLSLISQILLIGPIISKKERKNMKILVHKPKNNSRRIIV